jgi:group I intron endonuclease
MTTKTGIYKIINKVTGKVYIGSAVDIDTRWYNHKRLLSNNKNKLPKLQNSVNKHGIDNFIFEIVEECTKGILIEREQYWIDYFDSYENGYNSRPIASSNLGMVYSKEHKKKISDAHKGKIVSEETKNKMSVYWKKYYETHEQHNKGKTQIVSEEARKKISDALKGRTYEEIYGPEKAKEMREKRRLSALGKKHTEESKKKLSENTKRRWELGIHENNRKKKVN